MMDTGAPSVNSAPRSLALVGIVAVALWVLCAVPARAQISAEEAGQKVAEAYDVEVLKVSGGEVAQRAVWMVTVMFPGGNSNAAFQVNTLAVDRQSGELVPSFRHQTSGYVVPPGGRSGKVDVHPDSMRSGTWR